LNRSSEFRCCETVKGSADVVDAIDTDSAGKLDFALVAEQTETKNNIMGNTTVALEQEIAVDLNGKRNEAKTVNQRLPVLRHVLEITEKFRSCT
jgi:hypothetical protein